MSVRRLSHDQREFLALLRDVAFGNPYTPERNALIRRLAPDAPGNLASDREALVAELEVHYTRLDGGEVTLPVCNVFRLRDGSVVDYRSYMDIAPVYA